MSNSIQNINIPLKMPPMPPMSPMDGKPGQAGASFKETLLNSINEINVMQQDADKAVETLLTGGEANPAEVLTAVQKADLAFRMMMQVRNKLMQAFQEVRDLRI